MATTRFDILIDKEMRTLAESAMTLAAARDPVLHASIVGQHEALKKAKDLHRQANRTAGDGEDE